MPKRSGTQLAENEARFQGLAIDTAKFFHRVPGPAAEMMIAPSSCRSWANFATELPVAAIMLDQCAVGMSAAAWWRSDAPLLCHFVWDKLHRVFLCVCYFRPSGCGGRGTAPSRSLAFAQRRAMRGWLSSSGCSCLRTSSVQILFALPFLQFVRHQLLPLRRRDVDQRSRSHCRSPTFMGFCRCGARHVGQQCCPMFCPGSVNAGARPAGTFPGLELLTTF